MAEMTEEEAAALDEFWTKTIPKVKKGTGGVFTENRARMLLLDEATVRMLDAKARSLHETPSEFVTKLIRQSIAASL